MTARARLVELVASATARRLPSVQVDVRDLAEVLRDLSHFARLAQPQQSPLMQPQGEKNGPGTDR